MTDELTQALDQLVDRLDDAYGSWDEVISRADRGPGDRASDDLLTAASRRQSRLPRRPRRRLLAVALVILVALLALMATPAFGLRDAIFDLIGGKPMHFGSGAKAPDVVRYRFQDLAIGAPPGMDPQVIPNQTRKVGELKQAGRKRTLWVAPTRRGGFCYELQGSFGGCMRNGRGSLPPLTVITAGSAAPGQTPVLTSVNGNVFAEDTATVTIEFGDGTTADVPFLYVLAPINAGFFTYDLPKDRGSGVRAPVSIVSRDRSGKEIWREQIMKAEPRPRPIPPRKVSRRYLPLVPPVAPSSPLQQASANGGTVVVGRNGATQFDLTQLEPARKRMLAGANVTYGCFKLVTRSGKPYARGYYVSAAFRTKAGLRYFRIGHPIDGCEVQASGGHLWPDKLDSHSAAEIALTEAGRRYYEDRAAARDLALFVRSRTVHKIRKLPPQQAAAALEERYGDQISPLTESTNQPLSGRIGYLAKDGSLIFVRVSETGRRFEVVVTNGRIVSPTLKPWAFVF